MQESRSPGGPRVSMSPEGESFPLPAPEDYAAEFERLSRLAAGQREKGREIVVVVGVGFVGAVMAAVVAGQRRCAGQARQVRHRHAAPQPRSFWKIPLLNRGSPREVRGPRRGRGDRPVRPREEDPRRHLHLRRAEAGGCGGGGCPVRLPEGVAGGLPDGDGGHEGPRRVHGHHREKISRRPWSSSRPPWRPARRSRSSIPSSRRSSRSAASAPILSWPTATSGSCRAELRRLHPGLLEGLQRRESPLPGPGRQVPAGGPQHPGLSLTVLDRPIESETAKILENSFRATILAFMDEWSLFAERNGVDLKKVIEAVRVRPTHSNLIFPGPGSAATASQGRRPGGVGLPAHPRLGGRHLQDHAPGHRHQRHAALHAAQLVRDALRNLGRPIAAADVLILGAAYRRTWGTPATADRRSSSAA